MLTENRRRPERWRLEIETAGFPVVRLSPLLRGQRLREQTAGVKTFLSGFTRFLLVTKEMG